MNRIRILETFAVLTGLLLGCTPTPAQPSIPSAVPDAPETPGPATATLGARPEISAYAFPNSFDPAKKYMFYLHGRIIEEQGIPAISPEYGEYEYEAILHKLASFDFVMISEQRPKNTDGMAYGKKVKEQIQTLLNAGVPAKNITVIGASKGAGIAILISHLLDNEELSFVLMGTCDTETIQSMKQSNVFLVGNVLAIRDSADDEFAGSCQDLFSFSEGKGLGRHEEIVLYVGTGHGILYKPLDEWIIPAVEWANGQ